MSAFERFAERMDALTAKRMGKPIIINGVGYIGVESHFLPDFGPVTGMGFLMSFFLIRTSPGRMTVSSQMVSIIKPLADKDSTVSG